MFNLSAVPKSDAHGPRAASAKFDRYFTVVRYPPGFDRLLTQVDKSTTLAEMAREVEPISPKASRKIIGISLSPELGIKVESEAGRRQP